MKTLKLIGKITVIGWIAYSSLVTLSLGVLGAVAQDEGYIDKEQAEHPERGHLNNYAYGMFKYAVDNEE
jgi:hypothetical protein